MPSLAQTRSPSVAPESQPPSSAQAGPSYGLQDAGTDEDAALWLQDAGGGGNQSLLDQLGLSSEGWGGGLLGDLKRSVFGPDDEELEHLAGEAGRILAADPVAQAHYETFLSDPFGVVRSLVLGELLLAWEAFDRMDQVCRKAAAAEVEYLDAAGTGRGARMGLVAAFPSRATMALVNLRSVHPLTDAELNPLLSATEDDSRLGQAQSFVVSAFAGGAPALAERLYRMALARAQADGQTADQAERTALGVYTRAMPAGQTEADIGATREAYTLTLPLDLEEGSVDVAVRTPYHISSRLGGDPCPIVDYSEADVAAGDSEAIARKKVAYGKGSADEIEGVMRELVAEDTAGVRTGAIAAASGLTGDGAAKAAGAFVEQWMSDHDVGVDCSGFAFEATAQNDDAVGAGWQGREGGSLDAISMNGANVVAHKSAENSEEIPVSAARPGDLAINKSTSHIGVVEVPAEQVAVTSVAEKFRKIIRKTLGISEEQEADTLVWQVGIAHSVDQTQGQGGTDLPGPHLATYWYSDAGARLAQQDEQMSTFTTFHRPLLAPPPKSA